MRGAPLGNKNAVKAREWVGALRVQALANDGEKLRACAIKLFDLAMDGDLEALKEIGDRLDGKVKQVIKHEGDEEQPLIVQLTASAILAQKIRGVLERTTELTVIEGDKK
jgi:hypothetical protein